MTGHIATHVTVRANNKNTGPEETVHFEQVEFLRMDDHVWARGNHYVIAENPDRVTEGDTFLFDYAGPPRIASLREFEDGGEMAVMDSGMRIRVDVLTGEYTAAMGDPGPPPYLEEKNLE